jgi:hypothetical protein
MDTVLMPLPSLLIIARMTLWYIVTLRTSFSHSMFQDHYAKAADNYFLTTDVSINQDTYFLPYEMLGALHTPPNP